MAAPLLCGLFFYALFQFVLFIGYVPSASMEPTISANSFVLGTRIFGDLQRGDIVIFEHEGRMLTKRIAALSGDIVYIDDVSRTVAVGKYEQPTARIITVPDGHCFLLGDNVSESIDSRYWIEPCISLENIIVIILKII